LVGCTITATGHWYTMAVTGIGIGILPLEYYIAIVGRHWHWSLVIGHTPLLLRGYHYRSLVAHNSLH